MCVDVHGDYPCAGSGKKSTSVKKHMEVCHVGDIFVNEQKVKIIVFCVWIVLEITQKL